MSEDKIEEETYSVLFQSLKHPLRRRILRMLSMEPLSFSRILDAIQIDSGHLSYHLESLGDLIARSPDGKYRLSSIGVAAVRLMSGVEEHVQLPRAGGRLDIPVRIYPMILMLALLASGAYFLSITSSKLGWDGYNKLETDLNIPQSQSLHYNITSVHNDKRGWIFGWRGGNTVIVDRPPPAKTITHWEEGSVALVLTPNNSYNFTVRWFYGPEGRVVRERSWGGSPPGEVSLGWGDVTQRGTYIVEIRNVDSKPLNGTLTVYMMWTEYRRLYFYYGVAGVITALLYPALVILDRCGLRKQGGSSLCTLSRSWPGQDISGLKNNNRLRSEILQLRGLREDRVLHWRGLQETYGS